MAKISRLTLVLAALLLAAAPSVARAADDGDRPLGVWMASVDPQARAGGGSFGRLTLQDGKLTFRSMNGLKGWEVELADARRIEASRTEDKALEIENATGEVFYVAILNGQLMADSPRKALQAINVALKSPVVLESRRLAANANRTNRPETATPATTAAAGSSKVVRLDGGQVR